MGLCFTFQRILQRPLQDVPNVHQSTLHAIAALFLVQSLGVQRPVGGVECLPLRLHKPLHGGPQTLGLLAHAGSPLTSSAGLCSAPGSSRGCPFKALRTLSGSGPIWMLQLVISPPSVSLALGQF